jgi:hypothetical protein
MNIPKDRQITSKEATLRAIAQEISIPTTYDKKARSRYQSIGEWLDRPDSRVHHLKPKISAQGSFALGTVIRPVGDGDAYDVDVVCELEDGNHTQMSQAEIKSLVGLEIKAYATRHQMKQAPQDGRRCWTMEYADEADFHMDILPSIPGTNSYLASLVAAGYDLEGVRSYTNTAIGITDKKHDGYYARGVTWLVSNPKGYLRWFRGRQRQVLEDKRAQMNAAGRIIASVEDFPNHEVQTPLQDAIKLLKRHRDVMFDGDQHKPISIIISTLAATSYNGEATISETLRNILPKMQRAIEELGPVAVIPNPSYPAENFADKWPDKPVKRRNFERWIAQARQDFLSYLAGSRFDVIPPAFRDSMTAETIRKVAPMMSLTTVAIAASVAVAAEEAAAVKASGTTTKPWFPGE